MVLQNLTKILYMWFVFSIKTFKKSILFYAVLAEIGRMRKLDHVHCNEFRQIKWFSEWQRLLKKDISGKRVDGIEVSMVLYSAVQFQKAWRLIFFYWEVTFYLWNCHPIIQILPASIIGLEKLFNTLSWIHKMKMKTFCP